MSKIAFLQQLAAQLTAALPSHVEVLKQDFEKNCRMILTQAFSELDLVTREQFDTQTKVLLRTRNKLEALAAQVKAMEATKDTKKD
ncbi:MAG TPA: accessory factor UbiK family protein [Gammaproteobacteria bacterium]|jgi:hypothetical protein|nr:accessory factor UbiK family protein [Gammaproteobacteria bacterium]